MKREKLIRRIQSTAESMNGHSCENPQKLIHHIIYILVVMGALPKPPKDKLNKSPSLSILTNEDLFLIDRILISINRNK